MAEAFRAVEARLQALQAGKYGPPRGENDDSASDNEEPKKDKSSDEEKALQSGKKNRLARGAGRRRNSLLGNMPAAWGRANRGDQSQVTSNR